LQFVFARVVRLGVIGSVAGPEGHQSRFGRAGVEQASSSGSIASSVAATLDAATLDAATLDAAAAAAAV
jgi:hypothetical protein